MRRYLGELMNKSTLLTAEYLEKKSNIKDWDSWLRHDEWEITEAVLLSLGRDPNEPELDNPLYLESFKPLPLIKSELSNRCEMVRRSINSGILDAREEKMFNENYEPVFKKFINPSDFLKWANSKKFIMPQQMNNKFGEVMSQQEASHLNSANQSGHNKGQSPNFRPLPAQKSHREKCRGIASLVWKKTPIMTIEDMVVSNEIKNHGCDGTVYNENTIRDWIKDLCPNRTPGRRPKN